MRSSSEVQQLRAKVTQLQEVLRRMHMERARAARERRKRLLLIAVPVSLALHIALMIYLSMMYREGGGKGVGDPVAIEFAVVNDERLTSLDESDLTGLSLEEVVDLTEEAIETPEADLDVAAPSADLSQSDLAGLDTLGGAGDGLGGAGGLSAGGGGTSFFGIAGRGTRFAYIVDRSGSMSHRDRMRIANAELARSLQALPDYAHFHVQYFSSSMLLPPMQRDWLPARRQNVIAMVRWINSVDPGGGTMPRSSFRHIFEMETLPDVIFFMTDGIIASSALAAREVEELNSKGKRVVIHTIAFGDEGSEEILRQIARDSGGSYRYVPDGGVSP